MGPIFKVDSEGETMPKGRVTDRRHLLGQEGAGGEENRRRDEDGGGRWKAEGGNC